MLLERVEYVTVSYNPIYVVKYHASLKVIVIHWNSFRLFKFIFQFIKFMQFIVDSI